MDVEVLSRIQFAFTISFHYIYPPLSIGLGVMLVVMEGMYQMTGKKIYEIMTCFWIKIFALIFGIGVGIMLIIAAIGVPLVATYTIFVFWAFRGKVKMAETSY
ncbi:cytochrome ubiquinol oxidase subunit I [Mucilaginibacter sp. McL0603]|uniref:cytochrome ubiquinol oxidase subunit I n=1 Tax=Mucilaginibacter sp. McL0603 TaxID=3415670 RepID=UPI003CEED384